MLGLWLIAVICLALGLTLPSVTWLIASLIATAGAGYLLLKARSTILAPAAGSDATGSDATGSDATGSGIEPSEVADRDPAPKTTPAVVVADTASALAATTVTPAVNNRLTPASADDVWVIDGRPRYHLSDCAIIQGQDAEPIPFDQATEDGFMPCSLCEPSAVRAER